jgi:hypothetical protein
MTTIAHYDRPSAFVRNLAVLVFMTLLLWLVYFPPGGESVAAIVKHRPFLVPLFAIFTIGAPFAYYMLGSVLVQVVIADGRAVWIKDGRLVFLNSPNLNLKCADIEQVSIEPFGRQGREGIILRTRDGRQKIIPTSLLVESGDEIVSRIKAAIPTVRVATLSTLRPA